MAGEWYIGVVYYLQIKRFLVRIPLMDLSFGTQPRYEPPGDRRVIQDTAHLLSL